MRAQSEERVILGALLTLNKFCKLALMRFPCTTILANKRASGSKDEWKNDSAPYLAKTSGWRAGVKRESSKGLMEDGRYLEKVLLDILRREEDPSGLPYQKVKEELVEKTNASPQLAEQIIQRALDTWKIEKVLDYPPDSLELAWHLRLLTPKEREELQKLSPAKKALLKILWEKNTPPLGELPVQQALQKLREQGFAQQEVERIRYSEIQGKVRLASTITPDGQNIWVYYIISEFEREIEREGLLEDYEREYDEKQLLLMRIAEEEEKKWRRKTKGSSTKR